MRDEKRGVTAFIRCDRSDDLPQTEGANYLPLSGGQITHLRQRDQIIDLRQIGRIIDLWQRDQIIDLRQMGRIIDLWQRDQIIDLKQMGRIIDLSQIV